MNFKFIIKIIGPILFVYILSRIDFGELGLALRNINLGYFILALVFWFFHIVLRTLKWKMLVDSSGEKASFSKLLSMFAQGLFWGLVTPGKLGELSRASYLTKSSGLSLRKSFWTVIMDRIIDLLVAAFVSLVAVLVLVYSMEVEIPLAVTLFLLAIFLLSVYLLVRRKQSENVLKFFLRIILPNLFREKTQGMVEEFFEDSRKITLPFFAKLFTFELFYYFFIALALFFLALSLGLNIPIWYLYLIDPFISLVAVLPISIMGLGTRELSYAFLLAPLNIDFSQSVVYSLFVLFFNLLIGLPGLFLYLARKSEEKKQI
jgi:uncharacterized protein (TIRG00374 family)